ncbi:hypothetical protein QAD02_015926 [Eretmocerus hayati]|uniref:Uncharacterized protein n=1 Tax=Eretmocerus hayati TaxID=131215 RepID=A0ACC2P958_9HYME|nr:hypothetical protein QAD02_015926 [Eretmocerus hayati]
MSQGDSNRKKFGRLKWAIFNGHREIVEELLQEDTPVDNTVHRTDFRPPLHSSVYLGDPDVVTKLLDRGACVNVLDRNEETALMLAAKLEKYAIVDLILSDKRLKNCANKENLSHLHIACMRNRVDVVKKLMENEYSINTSVSSKSIRWSGYSPLHFAVQNQCVETVAFLLSIGADITIKNSNQLTALHLADMIRNEEIIDMILLAHGRVPHNPVNSEGLSHFHIACSRNNVEVVECFLRNGVKLDEIIHEDSLNWANYTAIDFAIHYDCVDVVKILLMQSDRKIFPSRNRSFDRVTDAYCSGNVQLINLLLNRDDLKSDRKIVIGELPALHYSCIYSDIEAVKNSLMEAPRDINTSIWQGSTPLHLAVERQDEAIIKYLLAQGADHNIRNADGKTPLHLAFERNMKEIVESMVNDLNCIDQNPSDNNGFSHLHIACIRNDEEATKCLIELETDVNAPVNNDSPFFPGFTPLHFTAKFASPNVAHLLLKHGASYFAINKYGQSAFDVAVFELKDFNEIERIDIMREILWKHENTRNESFNDRGRDLKNFILAHPNDINKATDTLHTRWDGYTPLHFAMLDDDPRHAILLIKMGASLLSKAANGDTPIHLCSFYNILSRIPDSFLDLNDVQHNPVGSEGNSIFHIACAAGNKQWVEYFLNCGVNPNIPNVVQGLEFPDRTPLHVAIRSPGGPKLEVVKLLLENGAKIEAKDHHLNTILHFIIDCVEIQVIDLFVSRGVDVNSRNAFLQTPLTTMCKISGFSSRFFVTDRQLSGRIASLLDHGADINAVDELGVTVLSLDMWDSDYTLEKNLSGIEVLLKHVIKLRTIGHYISDDIEHAYSKFLQRLTVAFVSVLFDFTAQCEKELELMMQVPADAYSTLRDVLFKNLNNLSVMSENVELQQMMDSNDFLEKYPIYGTMLKLQLKRGQERRPFLVDAVKSLKSLMNISVPRECLEQVLQFLSNEDLKNLIKSIEVLLKHVVKLKQIGHYVNDDIEQAYSKMLQRTTAETKFVLFNFTVQCRKELELMMQVRADAYSSLYDVLLKNLNKLSVISENSELQQMMESDDFLRKYPIYGSILKLQLKKG